MKLHRISKRIHVTFFTEAEKYGERHIGHERSEWPMLLSCHLYYLQETSNFLSFRVTTFSVFTIFKIWLQIRIYHKILIWKPVSYDFWRENSTFSSFGAIKFLNFKFFEIWLHFWSQCDIWTWYDVSHDMFKKTSKKSDFTRFGARNDRVTIKILCNKSGFMTKLDLLFRMVYHLWESRSFFFRWKFI